MSHPKEVSFWQEWSPASKTIISVVLQLKSTTWYTWWWFITYSNIQRFYFLFCKMARNERWST